LLTGESYEINGISQMTNEVLEIQKYEKQESCRCVARRVTTSDERSVSLMQEGWRLAQLKLSNLFAMVNKSSSFLMHCPREWDFQRISPFLSRAKNILIRIFVYPFYFVWLVWLSIHIECLFIIKILIYVVIRYTDIISRIKVQTMLS